ncbi:MAG: helix-turn-helix transcriptional regulator [Ardenticatenaceae bacterium]|nr:helix-turn-helix transcriptional regulator [Ardenticatenaceae bacterium]
MTNTYSFGEWIKQRRKQLKLTQREVATAVSLTPTSKSDPHHPKTSLTQPP